MKIFLLGYMGSGKSYLGKQLSEKLDQEFLDMDEVIENKKGCSISEIFEKRGEIFFRKLERKVLEELVAGEKSAVIALGGGTPCYGNNLDLIKKGKEAVSFYLKWNIDNLTERLFREKDHRPMISHLKEREELEEFIRKHLFERSFYYNQSDHIITCDDKSPQQIIEEIKGKLK